MHRLLPITSLVLLTVAFAMAASSNTTNSQMSQPASAKQMTIQGCLSSGADGSYALTDSRGNVWTLEGGTNQLKNNVGHTVAITGRGGDAAVLNGNSREYIDVDMASIDDFQVASVKQISPGCSAQTARSAQIEAVLAAE